MSLGEIPCFKAEGNIFMDIPSVVRCTTNIIAINQKVNSRFLLLIAGKSLLVSCSKAN